MTSDTQAWNAPLPPADDFAPLPRKQRRHLARIAAEISTLLAFTTLGVFAYAQHGDLTDTRADLADVTAQRDQANDDLSQAKSDNVDLRSQNQTLTKTAKQCSVYPAMVNHMVNAMDYELKAVQGGTFGSIIWLPKATAEMDKVTNLLDSHQSYDGELQAVCGPGSVSGT